MKYKCCRPLDNLEATLALAGFHVATLFWLNQETGEPVEKPLEKGNNQIQAQLTYDARSGNQTWATLVGGELSPHCTIPISHIISYVYLEIYLFFSSSFSLVAHNYLLHSSLGIAAYGVLALFEPFRNTWLALVYQGHATIEKQQQKTIIRSGKVQVIVHTKDLKLEGCVTIEVKNDSLIKSVAS